MESKNLKCSHSNPDTIIWNVGVNNFVKRMFLMCVKVLFICLEDQAIERARVGTEKRGREKKLFCSLVHVPNACNSWD